MTTTRQPQDNTMKLTKQERYCQIWEALGSNWLTCYRVAHMVGISQQYADRLLVEMVNIGWIACQATEHRAKGAILQKRYFARKEQTA